MRHTQSLAALVAALATVGAMSVAHASSHREAPFVTTAPKIDGTDFYMFRSYEDGREDRVVIVANYLPLQDAYGGPNYFSLDPNALYEIHIDNSGDGVEDITFQFRFDSQLKGLAVPVGDKMVPVPLVNIGQIGAGDSAAQNVVETYTLDIVRGDRRTGMRMPVRKTDGSRSLGKPIDNIGNKSIPDYPAYADSFIHDIIIPGCDGTARVFVGQRREGFVVNLGETFDLVNIAVPVEELGPQGQDARALERNTIGDKNVTSLALEVPAACLRGSTPIIGGWTTASLRQARVINPQPQRTDQTAPATNTGAALEGGAWTQVSRLGSPLVNEVVIGLPDKDLFNATEPKDDAARFADYVFNPTLPKLLEILFGSAGVRAPEVYPRSDLIAAFLTGIDGLTKVEGSNSVPSEMLRLNLDIPPTPRAEQNDLGVLGGDLAGFPNGRRPIDDVVDIELRAAMGVLLPDEVDPPSRDSRKLKYTDGARPDPNDYLDRFPFLDHPLPGSPNEATAIARR
ncbi:DUF4331 domain-containing protein [Sinimarinibacterium thermocellulolyticum]|uniref:DUF4331 domain-containing protein n=1 Tax=Sinimarinibacterium thermocellulolyticum TaxID=3170016 RepID=A0ABV2A5M4_9GAMM